MVTPITNEKQKLKILVVDDEYDVAITLKTILEEEEENGFEFYKQLRKIDDKVKVCFLTAFEVNYTNLKSKYNNLPDPNCVISKPISIDNLVNRVNQIMR